MCSTESYFVLIFIYGKIYIFFCTIFLFITFYESIENTLFNVYSILLSYFIIYIFYQLSPI